MRSAWHVIGPEALYWGPKHAQSLWKPKAILISENGCAADDVVAADGQVYDTDRIMFLRACLTQLHRATAEGVPVKGYFQWSTMDNFEWIYGYGNRFGLVHVDFETQKRTPKLSAASGGGRDHWSQAYSSMFAGGGIARGRVVGRTDKQAGSVTDRPISPKDVQATVYHLLGIDPHKQYPTPSGQQVPLVTGGKPIDAVIG